MRICLIATEIFSHGVYGGFGALTREIAYGLAQKGVEVYVIIPRKEGQKPVENIDNFTVISYPSYLYTGIKKALPYASIFKIIDADIYHSEEPSVGTYLAQFAATNKKHIVTLQDPRTLHDRQKEWIESGRQGLQLLKFKFDFITSSFKINKSVRNCNSIFIQAEYAIEKARRIYKLNTLPKFLPNPVDIPKREIVKSKKPLVCFLGRWDPRKRPEYFFELAKKFTDVEFIAMGGCSPGFEHREKKFREEYKNISNLSLKGWTFNDEKSKILESSWILINTSWRECLPVSYLEACAHKCAILSHENPDDFASNFGYWAKQGDIEDFSQGLDYLLAANRWKELGEKGFNYVKETHEYEKVIDKHIQIYKNLLNS